MSRDQNIKEVERLSMKRMGTRNCVIKMMQLQKLAKNRKILAKVYENYVKKGSREFFSGAGLAATRKKLLCAFKRLQ